MNEEMYTAHSNVEPGSELSKVRVADELSVELPSAGPDVIDVSGGVVSSV